MRQIARTRRHRHPFHNIMDAWINEATPLNQTTNPKANITEEEDSYNIAIVAPGWNKEDFDIQLNKDQLTISVERSTEHSEMDDSHNIVRTEFSIDSWTRTFHISKEIDREQISATYNQGILSISLGKVKEAILPPAKTIEIK